MSEKKITLSNIELVKLFGTNNTKLDKIKNLFPKLRIISRGEDLKLEGGVIYVGNSKILKSLCPGEFGSIKLQGICMLGVR